MLRSIIILAFVLASCGGNATERGGFGRRQMLEPLQLTSFDPEPFKEDDIQEEGGFFSRFSPKKPSAFTPDTVNIALLLPLSGNASSIGKAMQDAAQLALYDTNYKGLVIHPIDTQGASYTAAQAAKEAVKGGNQLIIGPLFSSTTRAVLPIAEEADVNVISFSNDRSLSGKGAYLMGFMPDQQIQRVASYALQKGLTDFAAIVPNDTYGSMAADEYTKTISEYGGNLHRTEYYLAEHKGVRLTLQRIVHLVLSSLPKEKKEKDVYFDNPHTAALFIPEGGDALTRIVSFVKSNQKDIQLLGSGQWDDAAIVNNPLLQGGWFAGTDPAKRRRFEQRFDDIYGYRPPRIASLAYDSVAFAVTLLRYEKHNVFRHKALTNPRGFAGVDGIFRLRPNGVSERGLAVLEIKGNGIKVIDAAPEKFSNF